MQMNIFIYDDACGGLSALPHVFATILTGASISDMFMQTLILYMAIVHYARIAISGDRRDAFQAGKSPASKVTVSDISHT
jgi:hypothetical protein